MRHILAVMCLTCNVSDKSVFDYAADRRSIWYNTESLPKVYQNQSLLYRVGYNIAGNLDKTGTPNNEKPWLHTGGLDNCGPEVTVKRMLWVPPEEKIYVKKEDFRIEGGKRNGFLYSAVTGEYPLGTVSAEFMYNGIELFEVRERRKTKDGWITLQHELADKPVGYKKVGSCIQCHEDIGKHAFQLDENREWYSVVRGLEKGGPIHWHPWKTEGIGGFGIKPEIRDEVKKFVEWRK